MARAVRAGALGLLLAACGEDEGPRPLGPNLDDEVERIDAGNVCSTSAVAGLSQQLVQVQMNCVSPGAFVAFDGHPNIVLTGSNVFPYMQASARDALWSAADQGPLHVTSAFRTLAQQYVLYHSGACGAAAKPGNSNHQSGRAVDLSNWSAAKGRMVNAGCAHPNYSGDPYHFDCQGVDWRSDSVRAFQLLWNINNPHDQIAVDGDYGPATEERLAEAPAGGFPTLGECATGGGVQAHARDDVYVLNRHGGAGVTEVHALDAAAKFEAFQTHSATALHPTDDDAYELGVGDFDGDGRDDLYMILRRGGSGTTEIHVLDAGDDFQTFLGHAVSALHPTDGDLMELFDFAIGDYNEDGRDDVYAIRRGGGDTTEVHALDAATHFGTFLTHAATALHPTDGSLADVFEFGVGDFNGDLRDDLYAISRSGGSGTTEIHVLDAATNFETFLAHAASALHPTADPNYDFGVGDYDGDGRDDLYMINRHAASETTEIHVLGAADHFQTFLLHVASAMHPTDADLFEFGVGAF